MRIIRFRAGGKTKYGVVEGRNIRSLKISPFARQRLAAGFTYDGQTYTDDEVRPLAPCKPSKIVCLGLNYYSHAEETKLEIPKVPLIFIKPSTSVIGPGDKIILPPSFKRVDYEGELGVVIGRKARDVEKDRVHEYILGYTCVNDVSDRYAQKEDGQWTRAKSRDTFCPLGPCIQTEIVPDNLKIETRLNGELRQSGCTRDLIFGVQQCVSFISSIMLLLPGDVIATGTPSGIGPLSPGDVVEVKIEGIGSLINPVALRQKGGNR
jgi:2-keto-4-pentenoate hydratase/2-oxohepta-3-ene-1,7-dioic acid hydratase in catechol pathway